MQDESSENLEKLLVVAQEWLESEQGWGTRPDGCSLHLDMESYRQYVNEYWNGMPDEIPHEYERPAGSPFPLSVSQEVYEKIKESKNGIRLYENAYCDLRRRAKS